MRVHAELVKLCIQANKTFSDKGMTLDTHLENFIKEQKVGCSSLFDFFNFL